MFGVSGSALARAPTLIPPGEPQRHRCAGLAQLVRKAAVTARSGDHHAAHTQCRDRERDGTIGVLIGARAAPKDIDLGPFGAGARPRDIARQCHHRA